MANEKKWKDFLSSIKPLEYLKKTEKFVNKTKSNANCLATEFAVKYRLSAQNDDAINSTEEEPQTDEVTNRNRNREAHTPSTKNNKLNSCCGWKVSDIAKFFSFDDCVTEIKMPTRVPSNLDKIYKEVQEAICRQLKVVKGSDCKPNVDLEFLSKLISITSIESGSRLVLDALLIPLCFALDLQFEVEKTINYDFLPNCRFDYCIRKGKHIIGCIEAKSVKSLSSSSVAQAVMELMVLQTTLMQTETSNFDISTFPVFAIVTDGHRFIYMQLNGSSLRFEHNNGTVLIREVRQESDFKDIIQHISFLVEGDQSEDDLIPQLYVTLAAVGHSVWTSCLSWTRRCLNYLTFNYFGVERN